MKNIKDFPTVELGFIRGYVAALGGHLELIKNLQIIQNWVDNNKDNKLDSPEDFSDQKIKNGASVIEAGDIKIYDTAGFSVRAANFCHNYKIETLGQLAQLSEKAIVLTPNIGHGTLNEIKVVLASHGLKLLGNVTNPEDL